VTDTTKPRAVIPSPAKATTPTGPQGSPTRVRVVSRAGGTQIDATLVPTRLNSARELAPPPGRSGWYAERGWAKPGYPGASILVGHITHQSQPDVFWNLPRVRPGDRVTVSYSSGDTTSFRVVKSAAKSKDAVPKDGTIWDYDNPAPLLRLLTCDPTTSFVDQHYTGNWVVWAVHA